MPYTEALKGENDNIYTPKYDAQEVIFQGILADLKTASGILQNTKEPIKGDIIYNGDLAKWQKAINSFRLKVLMTLSKKEQSMPHVKSEFASIINGQPIIASNADNMQVVYLDRQGNRYPLFNDSGFGSGKYMDSTFVALMAKRQDARLITFVTQTKNSQDKGLPVNDYSSYEGGNPIKAYSAVNDKAVAGNISKPHPRYYENPVNEPKVLLGYTETELIIAEGIVRGWINGNAETHYNNAIRASFDFYNSHVPSYGAYLNSNEAEKYIQSDLISFSKADNMDKKLELIMVQQYISTYFHGTWTAYNNYLRTGYPKFLMSDGV
ncbi:MAG: SusD/RagB family nutrient-binding outer membrane lipoprotein, partial [Bacteroidia bacterium]|nr:SusD/RagB family nutrient-binding outer membrane lipoprotein [Bacteroidia bacterium]